MINFFCFSVGRRVLSRDLSRRDGACHAGEARARAAIARRIAARRQSRAAGQADAMAILTRRTLMRTSAPILSSLRRMVPQVACANAVSCRPIRRRAHSSCNKAQLASDRMSCHSATANQVLLVLHTAAFWLMHGVRAAIPQASPLAKCEFATIRERLIKIGARVIEHVARIRVQLPTGCPHAALFRWVALGLMLSGP